jgi:hypothetical protein
MAKPPAPLPRVLKPLSRVMRLKTLPRSSLGVISISTAVLRVIMAVWPIPTMIIMNMGSTGMESPRIIVRGSTDVRPRPTRANP